MEVDGKAGDLPQLRLLAVFCNPEEEDPGYDPPGPASTPSYAAARAGAQVEVMEAPSMAELAAKLEDFKPTMLYIRGSPGATHDNVKGHLAPIYIANGPDKLAENGDLMAAMEEPPGWADTRLIAPRAEARVLIAGGTPMLDAPRLAYLGEALRALLVIEARAAALEGSAPLDAALPAPLAEAYPGCSARRCRVRTASGARVAVVVVGREGVLGEERVLQYALRQMLVSDALAPQFRLPPAGTPLPLPKSSDDVMGGVPHVEALLTQIGVWAVDVLRQLAKMPTYQGLLALGIAGVGSAALQGTSKAELQRRTVIVTGARPIELIRAGHTAGGPSTNPLAVPADPPLPPHCCGRAPITEVSEEEFMGDLVAFLSQRRNKAFDRSKFPDVVLNGSPLDVFVLYKEVVTRGGFRVGNGINWKGQVFAKMRNWTANNRQTGVGAALKKHYANMLWEYEQAHPADALTDRCIICGSGEEQGLTDWIACDSCESWVHFSCDKRAGLGTFASYSGDNGRTYTCPSCTRSRAGPGGSGGRSDDGSGDGDGDGDDDGGEGGGGSGDDEDDPMDS
ncbi:hypothetical protein Rsub_12332 [Raphidocelis subcapitata]|uniref:ARID domain-containing protein n=1 Tax=Raphidocelis subcapitata TaxID=307507 RepID=A0A2V0PIK5_9CHLO|nr:hypothetical protein Rsub_12332 [Raphidocelis subcapitata]|eukprot:GBF99399.1 hypothetical protein Rsub_12332 [Raphidocelis subcapitata]